MPVSTVPSASRRHPLRWFAVGLVALAMLLGGCLTPTGQPPAPRVYASMAARAEAQVAVLDQVWSQIDRRFYDPAFNGADWATARERYREAAAGAASEEELYDVLNEMLEELGDAHTVALTPLESWEDQQAQRAFVGVNIERIEGQWIVVELRPGGAAAEAGIQPGWIVVARDGEPLSEAGVTFNNEPGQTYTWTFRDLENRERDVALTARTLPDWMPPAEWHAKEGWVYLRFDEFEPDYQNWLRTRLRANRKAPGIVLDLRQNAGGAVSSLERVITDFFPKRVAYGAFVSRKGRRDEERSAWLGGVGYEGALVVLIGPGSASSAEILAHVFKHYDRAVLVGRPTAGVVVASQFFRLRDGGELQIGTYDYESMDGTRLEGNGVAPDIEVERTLADVRAGRDPDLDAAVDWLRATVRPAARETTRH